MRKRRIFLSAALISTFAGCRPDGINPMADTPKATVSLFAPGTKEQQTVDNFLARFSPETAARLSSELATGRTRLVSRDPELRAQLDVIYAALDARNQSAGRPRASIYVERYTPGPVEAALIEEYLRKFDATTAARMRDAFLRSDVEVGSDNPDNARLLKSIYTERRKSSRSDQ